MFHIVHFESCLLEPNTALQISGTLHIHYFKSFSGYLCYFVIMSVLFDWHKIKKIHLSKIYPHFFIMGDSATPGNNYSSYSKYRRVRREKLKSGALWSYGIALAKVNVVLLQGFYFLLLITFQQKQFTVFKM